MRRIELPERAAGGTRQPFRPGHRLDLQVLRGIAVCLVVLYHAEVPGLNGGFIGVDLFLVLSGYLIARLLVAEQLRDGSIDLLGFIGRRVRRLLPAATVVLVTTAAVWAAVATPAERVGQRVLAVGTALLAGNLALVSQGRDYLAAPTAGSPFEHWWSVSLEEQFYLVWPVLLLVMLRTSASGDRSAARQLARTGAAIGGLALLSLLWGVRQTEVDPVAAYLLLPSRAWQLLAGGMLAVVELRGLRPTRLAARALAVSGAVLLTGALLGIDATTPYPGTAALLPTSAALALIAAGIGRDRPHVAQGAVPPARSAPAAVRGLAWLGDRSYSLYLWHWPALALLARARGGPAATVEQLGTADRAMAVVAALWLATATYRLVENPARWSNWLRHDGRATAAGGLALLLLGAGATLAVTTASTVAPSGPPALPDDALLLPALPPPVAAAELLRPSLENARRDVVTPRPCLSVDADPDPAPLELCAFGDPTAGETVVAWGDSHVEMWRPALDEWARSTGRRGVLLWKSACSPFAIPPIGLDGRHFTSCESWRVKARATLAGLEPDVLLVAGATAGDSFPVTDEEWGRAIPAGLDQLAALSPASRIVLLGDVPLVPDVPVCVAEHGPADPRCDGVPSTSIREIELRAAAERPNVTYVDTTSWLCRDGRCPAVMADVLVYRDDDHVSHTFARYLAPVLVETVP